METPTYTGEIDIDKNMETINAIKNPQPWDDERKEEEAFWENHHMNCDEYDEFLNDVGSVADAMSETVLGGTRRIEMAELIQQIEKTPSNTNYLLIQLGKLLVDGTTDELARQAAE